jgi:hypothetical protein
MLPLALRLTDADSPAMQLAANCEAQRVIASIAAIFSLLFST